MAPAKVGILPSADRQAIIEGARKLGLDPYQFGAFLSLESGPNMDPNIVGGAGGRYRGMIQFGPAEQQKYLDPSKTGKYTRAEQMPAVLQFFQDRGYKPGMGIERAYATVLGGNPNVSLNAKDSFGTSVAGAAPRFKAGGDLYENAKRVLGDVNAATVATTPQKQEPSSFAQSLLKGFIGQLLQPNTGSSLMPMLGQLNPVQQGAYEAELLTPQSPFFRSLTGL